MYSFDPSEEQKMLVDVVKRYAMTDLRANAREADETGELPIKIIQKGWELGALQASIPEEYGGFGEHSVLTGILALENFAYGDLAGAIAVMTPGSYVIPIFMLGTEEQKKSLIPPVIEADWQPYTAALIENSYNFDPNDLTLQAEDDADGFVLNGEKTYVPYAGTAIGMVVYAKYGGKTKAFVVDPASTGIEIGARQQLLGIHALPLFAVRFNHVHVPRSNILAGTDQTEFNTVLAMSQTANAALAVGMSQAALDYAIDYAKEREVFGVKVAQKQAIAFMLAEMAIEIEAIRLLTWEAAWRLDQRKPDAFDKAHLAVTGAGDMAMMVTDRALQVLGGHGYIREHPVEMWMRNGRGIPIFTGLALI